MNIKEDLKHFYDSEAKKYASSRKKHRSDGEYILDEIKNYGEKKVSILEFGCGSGRLLDHLQELKGININYTGVDISNELLKIAKKNYKKGNTKFIYDDIINYIKTCEQESFDFVIGTASFQHLINKKERLILIKNAYRILKYNGELIMTNRALSLWFFKKHTKQISRSLIRYLITFGKHDMRDILVPRKSKQGTFHRYYHFFSIGELKKLIKTGGFIIKFINYLDQKGDVTPTRKNANNSLLIAQKSILKDLTGKDQ